LSRTAAVTPDQFATFGELLKYLRRRAGLTQRELSIAVGYSDTQISRLEQNQRVPNAATLTALFVPALHIEQEPEWAARLLELAAEARRDDAVTPTADVPASSAPRHNLPIQLTSFVGREHDLAEVKRLLSTTRLLTLTGSGGCGKSRLSLQAAAEMLAVFSDGTWLIELASLANPALVPQTVAVTLGMREEAGRSFLATLADGLRPKKALLVLDNCEHLVEACAQLVQALLQTCPNLHIVATSREELGVPGEVLFRVPSLSTPDPHLSLSVEVVRQYDAVRLFVERATTAWPGFMLTGDNALAVALVCYRLDGIPLAIELAAARLKVLKVEQIAGRLDDRFHLLTGGSRTALPHHQTLQAMIDWSYDLLSGPERALLRRLSVFAGGWTLEAAEAVCGGDEVEAAEVLDLLVQLVNKSLVVAERERGREARYRLLETIRQYAREKLAESGEEEKLRERHRDWFSALAERAEPELRGGRDPISWLNRLEAEHDNLRTALEWSLKAEQTEAGARLAVALWPFWQTRGYYQEGRDWLEAGLARRGRLPKALLAQMLRTASWMLQEPLHDLDSAKAYAEESVILYRELGDKANLAWAIRVLGYTIQQRGNFDRATELFGESLALSREIGDKWGLAQSLVDSGWAAVFRSDYTAAISLLEESLTLERELEDVYGIAHSAYILGFARLFHGEADEAARLFRGSLTVSHQLNDKWFISGCLTGLAGVASALREPVRAARLWGVSNNLDETVGAVNPPYWGRFIVGPILASIRSQLDEAAFAAAYAEGRALTMEQAIEYALATDG